MTGMQELMLVATVNMRYHHVSRGLISVFQGASFVNFAIFDPVFLSFSNAFQGEVGYNTFIDYFQYHPSVIGKMFLVNVRCYVCFAIVSLLVFGVGALLAMKYDYFRRLRESYIFSGLYYTVQLGFIDVTLGAIVQFQNFAFSHGPLYTLGNVAACFAFVGEVVFLVGCASLMLAKSKDSLLVPEFRDRYGAIYSDLKTGYTKLHMFTTVFHNCRCFFLVVFMALAYTSPVAQAVGFLMVTLVGLGWDVYFRPYRGRLLTAQVLVLDVCKFAAAIGYIVLAKVKSVDTGDKFSGFVVVVMGLAMGVGVILGIVQQVLGVYQQSKENAVSSIMPDSARPIRSPEGSMSQIGMRHKGSTVGLNS